MSVILKPLITQAGLAAVMNASGDGLQATITHVALGDVGYEPDRLATSLKGECNRVPISQGRRMNPNQIHITAIENGDKSYWVHEVGFVLSDGTLLAIWSHPTQQWHSFNENSCILRPFENLARMYATGECRYARFLESPTRHYSTALFEL